jgi:hypothetical protein
MPLPQEAAVENTSAAASGTSLPFAAAHVMAVVKPKAEASPRSKHGRLFGKVDRGTSPPARAVASK